MRRVLTVLRHPAVAPAFPHAQRAGFTPPMGERALYFKVGRGLIAYYLHEDYAEVHAALLPGDGGDKATAAMREQYEHVLTLVPRIVAAPVNALSVKKARALGMQDTGRKSPNGFAVYEVRNG